MKKRTFEILEQGEKDDSISRYFDLGIIVLILLNILAVILESVQALHDNYEVFFEQFELFSVIVFSIEYVLRLWTITEVEKYKHPVWGRLRYIFSFVAIIDLLAVLPFYMPLLLAVDSRVLRALRIFRIFRLLKFKRYSRAVNMIYAVLREKKEQLIISITITLTLLILVSCFMYFIEHDDQPEAFSSIPATMWWGVATLTTVGYGDVYPITVMGKILGAIMAILGVGVFALPAGILATGFGSIIEKDEDGLCDNCGQPLPDQE